MNSSADTVTIAQIGSCEEPRLFTLAEARSLLPVIQRITGKASEELEPVKIRIENTLATDPRFKSVEQCYEDIVRRWVKKMERLGLVVHGLWMVDFDTGDGYISWQYPEIRLAWFHEYSTGIAGRLSLEQHIEENMPDWA